MKHTSFLICLLLTITACRTQKATQSTTSLQHGPAWGALWQQRAAEYKALCLQAYQLAAIRVEEMSHQQTLRPRAVVTDIDETVLDNSPFSVTSAFNGQPFTQQAWEQWTSKAICDTVPGALAFFKYAASTGLTIYYITNRQESERAATLKNLRKWDFPFADNEHLILSSGSSDKEPRRSAIEKKYEIAMLVGDNLGDFSDVFYKKTSDERNAAVERLHAEFGRRFIMLPNVMYGDWLSSLLPKNVKLNAQQMDSVLRHAVKGL